MNEVHADHSGKPPGLLIVMHDIPAELDSALNHWYHSEHLSERLGLPGFQSVRRYQATENQPSYMVVYKCDSIDALITPEYRHLIDNPTKSTLEIMPRMRQVIRAACRETWTTGRNIGGTAVVAQCKAVDGQQDRARRFIQEQLAQRLREDGSMVSLSLWEADPEITLATTSDTAQRTGPDHYVDWVLMIEGHDTARLSLALHSEALQSDSKRDGLLIGTLKRYNLMCIYHAQS
ncbi:Uncharacterised protein [Achromobacter xylosoxidans]|uniref:DUF4286 family protein n=1 Tax=Alcaligenes xylosoxydans xylosoxydans TaxID=85698 RepID=UPI0006BFED23|nr:DUF4286 family protein [Achromobacter xylosoxidans]CUJ31351.1 Uncharacterised protein [Achromobacter xylosoxidans]CUJ71426.1 Uncharacterised protein [Achromobacter xylosoxidans]